MKVFNIENGEEKVYVQLEDLTMLNQVNAACPLTIYHKLYGKSIYSVDSLNCKKYIQFDTEEEVAYFKRQDWILNYGEVKSLSLEELAAKFEEVQYNLKYLQNLQEKRLLAEKGSRTLEIITYKKKSLSEYIEMRKKGKEVYLPVAPDYDGFFYEKNKESRFVVREGLASDTLLVLRRDGEELTERDNIPQILIEDAIKEYSMLYGDIESYTCSSSERDMYLVIKLKKKEPPKQTDKLSFPYMKVIADKLFNSQK